MPPVDAPKTAIDWTGAGDAWTLGAPRAIPMTSIASGTVDKTAWRKVTNITRPSILKPIGGPRLVRFTPAPPDDTTISEGRFYAALDGICYLLVPGIHNWYFNLPTDGTPGTEQFVLLDAMSAIVAPSVGGSLGGSSGTNPQTATTAAITGASGIIAAADATRGRLWVSNPSASAKIYIAFGAAAVNGSGAFIAPGGLLQLEPESGLAQLQLRGLSDDASSFNAGVQAFK